MHAGKYAKEVSEIKRKLAKLVRLEPRGSRCERCGRLLTAKASRARGMGLRCLAEWYDDQRLRLGRLAR